MFHLCTNFRITHRDISIYVEQLNGIFIGQEASESMVSYQITVIGVGSSAGGGSVTCCDKRTDRRYDAYMHTWHSGPTQPDHNLTLVIVRLLSTAMTMHIYQ